MHEDETHAYFAPALHRHAARRFGFIARKLKNNFYLLLAGLFTLFILADVFFLHVIVDMRQKAYDLVIKNRIIKPKPDDEIIIVDVNEASLSNMAKDYGRWPWQVFGEFVENG